jgi:hypothetical protein
MSLKILKNLTVVVGVCVLAEVACLGGTIYTAVQHHHYEVVNTPSVIATPASIPVPAAPNPPSLSEKK